MNNLQNYDKTIFESIKHIDEFGNEWWSARDLQKALQYIEWRKFINVIEKAKIACKNSKNNSGYDFVHVDKIVKAGATYKKIEDYKLSRYACYLIVQNSDPRKKVIALGQTYFAVQTRRQELFDELTEDERRLDLRKRVRKSNYGLNRTAVNSGVKNLAEFHNAGYKGLYNGETADDIFKRKKLNYREDILDNMGSVELGANLFRITQTDDKLKRDNVDDEYTANSVHYNMGRDIRKFIKNQGGIMPEVICAK